MAKTTSMYTKKLGKIVAKQAKVSTGSYHVIPAKVDKWDVVAEGSVDSFKKFNSKNAAVTFAKKYAANLTTGEVIVHGIDGRILNRISC